tara:strand:+ start:694 stop:1032 length:339 start_codon:yes stop_codon:yes gene_type:complete
MNYLLYFSLLILTDVIIWFQGVAPIRFASFLSKYTFVVYLMGLGASILFVEATKAGAIIFNSAWTLRFIGFSINTIVFGIFTHFFVGKDFSPKTLICLGLSLVIVLVQCFCK